MAVSQWAVEEAVGESSGGDDDALRGFNVSMAVTCCFNLPILERRFARATFFSNSPFLAFAATSAARTFSSSGFIGRGI